MEFTLNAFYRFRVARGSKEAEFLDSELKSKVIFEGVVEISELME